MGRLKYLWILFMLIALGGLVLVISSYAHTPAMDEKTETVVFPVALEAYGDEEGLSLVEILKRRISLAPFNLVASGIFLVAIIHSLMTGFFHRWAHHFDEVFKVLQKKGLRSPNANSMSAAICHILGEVEVVFGIWVVVLGFAMAIVYDWETFVTYVNSLSYHDPLFIIVIMTIAASRPVVKLCELVLWHVVKLVGDTLHAWWIVIMLFSSLLGSFITEPAAMTIGALLLSDKFYVLKPSKRLKYATLALLFVNISIGGVLTNFASPPVLMVASLWRWDIGYMMLNFGWKSVVAIVVSTILYYLIFRKDFEALAKPYKDLQFKRHIQHRFISKEELSKLFEDLERNVDTRMKYSSEVKAFMFILRENIKELAHQKLTEKEIVFYDVDNAIDEKFDDIALEELRRTIPALLEDHEKIPYEDPKWDYREDTVPFWIMSVHVLFMIWTVFNGHEPVLFLGGFLFYLGFFQVTSFYQNRIDLKPSLLVGFFLAGLVIHGTLQEWWIEPILGNLQPFALNITSTLLTAFNDNAAITYLSTFVPDLSEAMKYAVVSGAITGGGLTVIANAPNPIGQSILKQHFESGIEAGWLMVFALLPTIVAGVMFNLL